MVPGLVSAGDFIITNATTRISLTEILALSIKTIVFSDLRSRMYKKPLKLYIYKCFKVVVKCMFLNPLYIYRYNRNTGRKTAIQHTCNLLGVYLEAAQEEFEER